MAIVQVNAKYTTPCYSGDDMILEVFSSAALSTTNLRFVVTIVFPSYTGIKDVVIYADPIADPTITYASYAQFNLSDKITSALAGQPHLLTDLPGKAIAGGVTNTKLAMTFTVSAAEYSGNPVAVVNTISPGAKKVLLGGNDFAAIYTSGWFFSKWAAASTKQFLTWMPKLKKITYADQAEWLTFIAHVSGSKNYRVNVGVKKKDGSSLTFNNIFGNIPLNQYDVRRISVSIAAFKLAQPVAWPADSELDNYNVVVQETAGGSFTETRWYYLDQDYQPYRKKIVWLNSLSGINTFSFTGKSKLVTEVTDIETNRHHSYDYDLSSSETTQLLSGQRKSAERKEQASIKVSTGYQTKELIDGMRDLHLSSYAFEDVNGKLIPIRIVPGTFNVYEDGQDHWSMNFEYKYLFANKYYTPWATLFG